MKTRIAILSALAVLLAVATGTALAVAPFGYRVGWLVPLTGGGGAPAGSAHYAVNLTVGQTGIGSSGSAHYAVALGFWPGVAGVPPAAGHRLQLPLALKDFVP